MAVVKRLLVYDHSPDYFFWSFGITEFILNYFENIVPLKPVLGAWTVFHILLLVMNRLNQTSRLFSCLGVLLAIKGSNYPKLTIFNTMLHHQYQGDDGKRRLTKPQQFCHGIMMAKASLKEMMLEALPDNVDLARQHNKQTHLQTVARDAENLQFAGHDCCR